ncbi:CRISPR-associated helicase Cas3' [Spiractinospora alimapuensis]|uniref:CRISPR-associated helicase Cas3' n=1 Tax=Spiractinospora alimapuensis TaxID=2820884 RepID=UPI001F4058B2|nr:CRISPR-associated helicase Cas3' [Spiractinospora alimapuensis]QVQ53396.1 CRISPR-associated helicase Cas3' [Spiractinospora alimapuensis]
MAGDELYAHSADGAGVRHRLDDHLRAVGDRAGGFGEAFRAAETAGYLGLVHDVGKGWCEWQDGLRRVEGTNRPVGLDHKGAGTWLAHRADLGVLASVVAGHHGGLPAFSELGQDVRAMAQGSGMSSAQEAIDRVAAVVPEILEGPGLPGWLTADGADALVVDSLVRFVFSAVVDADHLDTAAHFDGVPRQEHGVAIGGLVERYEEALKARLARRVSSPVDGDRARVYEQAVAAAQGPQGIYRLPAPTGSGKTFAAGGFGLHHARVHGLRRVIVAVPYLSITEQNAAEYRRLLEGPGEPEVVLEHHSGVDLDATSKSAGGRWARLAAENWDAPFIVTTTVRLFESLFGRRPAAMRRVHRLAGSVIVLDEVQALPDRLLVPIMSMLRTLTDHFGVTVLLASATQPTFFELSPLRDLAAREVIADPKPLYTRLQRVNYEWWLNPAPSREELAEEVAECRASLTVCNTTAQARELHALVAQRRDESAGPVLHLSTRMVARHRRETVRYVSELNAAGSPVAVVSTQLVEAGVDLDFPVVFRAFATAEAMQQAAGRCNRSGRLERGRVVVFELADGDGGASSGGGEFIYGAALAATRMFFGPGKATPDDLDALDTYYRERFKLTDTENDGEKIQDARREWNFPEVTNLFRMIKEETVPVVAIPPQYEAERERIQEVLALLRGGVPGGGLLRELRPYMATLPKSLAFDKASGLLAPVVGDLHEWLGDYDERRGIEISDSEEYVF